MSNRLVTALRFVVVLGVLTAILANAATTYATPTASVQRLTGKVLLIDPHQDRPLALVKTGWQEAVVRFPHRGHLNAFDVDDLLRLQVAPSRDWVFDVVRVELVVRMDRSHGISGTLAWAESSAWIGSTTSTGLFGWSSSARTTLTPGTVSSVIGTSV